LRRSRFFTGAWNDELHTKDCTWVTPDGTEMADENWSDENARCMGVIFDGRAQATGLRRMASDATLLMVFNAHHDMVVFMLPEITGGARWELLLDTNRPEQDEIAPFEFGHRYEVTARSFLLFALRSVTPKGIIRHAEAALRILGETPLSLPSQPPQERRGGRRSRLSQARRTSGRSD
jgi:glycogen operon protein